MAVPEIARAVAAVVGGLLVLAAATSVVGTLIVPRPVGSWLTRFVDKAVNGTFRIATAPVKSYRRRDRIFAAEAAVLLLAQLAAWLIVFYLGYALLFWPFVPDITDALITAGPGLWGIGGIGSAEVTGAGPRIIQDLSALSGIITITLQISYLPTLYGAFSRRENEIALLTARAGVPSWGPELLARTRYALGSGLSTIDTLPDLYERWEAWAADVAESHTTYLPLVRFRSPKPRNSWVISLLAVLDSAALYLTLAPGSVPEVQARLCLRSGLICLGEVARAMGLNVPQADAPDMTAGLDADLRGVPGGGAAAEGGGIPDRARAGGGLDGVRRLAGQLREGRLRDRLRGARRPGAVVRAPAAPGPGDLPAAPGARPAAAEAPLGQRGLSPVPGGS